jgi:hypothetical protein
VGVPLERSKADMGVVEPDEDGGAGGGGLVISIEGFAGLDEAEGLGCIDAEGLEHFGGEDLPDAAFQGEAPVAAARIRCLAAAFGAEIEEPAGFVSLLGAVRRGLDYLREQKSAAVVIDGELMAVVPEGEGSLQVFGEGLEAAEVIDPLVVAELAEAHAVGPALISEPEGVLGKAGGLDGIVKAFTELENAGGGAIALGDGHAAHSIAAAGNAGEPLTKH